MIRRDRLRAAGETAATVARVAIVAVAFIAHLAISIIFAKEDESWMPVDNSDEEIPV